MTQPIERHDLYAGEMSTWPDGRYVRHADHAAAIAQIADVCDRLWATVERYRHAFAGECHAECLIANGADNRCDLCIAYDEWKKENK